MGSRTEVGFRAAVASSAIGLLIAAGAMGGGGSPVRVRAGAAFSCHPTAPNAYPPPADVNFTPNYGNGDLWTVLPDAGTIDDARFVRDNGVVGWKFLWWRAVNGALRLHGRRLDATAPHARGVVPFGYGPTGFQA